MDYLVQYGHSGFVGRFAADCDDALSRGSQVVVRTPRGVEPGVVLCPVDRRVSGSSEAPADGELLRPAADRDRDAIRDHDRLARELLDAAESLAATLPLTLLDAEILLDRSAAILHVLPHDTCNADALVETLSRTFGLAVRLFDVTRTQTVQDPPEPKTTCGKPGCGTDQGGCSSCGTEKGGCGTGSCSKGKVKSAEELTGYFADLRQKMEAASAAGRTPLN